MSSFIILVSHYILQVIFGLKKRVFGYKQDHKTKLKRFFSNKLHEWFLIFYFWILFWCFIFSENLLASSWAHVSFFSQTKSTHYLQYIFTFLISYIVITPTANSSDGPTAAQCTVDSRILTDWTRVYLTPSVFLCEYWLSLRSCDSDSCCNKTTSDPSEAEARLKQEEGDLKGKGSNPWTSWGIILHRKLLKRVSWYGILSTALCVWFF